MNAFTVFRDLVALKGSLCAQEGGRNNQVPGGGVQFLHKHEGMEQPLAEARLIVSGRDVVAVKNDQELMSVLSKPGQSCLSFVVDLPAL